MIRIAIESDPPPDGRCLGLSVEGHAGLAAAGSDVLCAAVSVLAENLGSSLRLLLDLPVEAESGAGLYRIRLTEEQCSPATELLFQSTLLGMRVLAEQFPERIELRQHYTR
jgi:hypothetical protein